MSSTGSVKPFFSLEEGSDVLKVQELGDCSDCNVSITVKHTFISVARTSTADTQPSVRRRRTYPLRKGTQPLQTLPCSDELEPEGDQSDGPRRRYTTQDLPRTDELEPEADHSEVEAPDVKELYSYSAIHTSDSDFDISRDDTSANDLSGTPCVSQHDSFLEPSRASALLSPCYSTRSHIPMWRAMYPQTPHRQLIQAMLQPPPSNCTDKRNGTDQERDIESMSECEIYCPLQTHHQLRCLHVKGTYQVTWYVEKRKLSTPEKQITSPTFLISFGNGLLDASCKLVLNSQGQSFKRSRGHGQVNIKCDTVLPEASSHVSARFIVGSGLKEQGARGPVTHSFAESATCGLSKKQGVWDFRASVNKMARTVAIRVEITPTTPSGFATQN